MKKLLTITAFTVGSLAAISYANADIFSRSGSVQIVEPLALSAGTNLAFGKVQKPATGSQTVIITSAGVVSGTATLVGGTTTAGSYTLTGDPTATVGITIADTTAVSGLTLTAFTPTYGGTAFTNGATGLAAPTSTGKALAIGATLNVASTVTSGAKTLGYNITVVYQ